MTDFANEETSSVAPSSQPLLHQHGHEIQEYATLRLLPLALGHDARLESCQLLNQILADTQILYSLYKKQLVLRACSHGFTAMSVL